MRSRASRFASAAALAAALAVAVVSAASGSGAGAPSAAQAAKLATPGAPPSLASDRIYFVMTDRYANGETAAPAEPGEAPPPGQTALFNSWEDAVECARCGGRMVRTGSCYTCRDCGTNTGCS